jgi:phosphate starvation-inducible PhoH-like protein
MANLCGPLDAHLREIEAGLSVRLERRGDDFQVHGPRGQAQRALALLCSLHERAGRPIGARTLQLALAEARASSQEDPAGADAAEGAESEITLHTRRSDLRGRTPNQLRYLRQILDTDITFGIGPAGTGKTYLAMAMALTLLKRRVMQRIVLTRPAVEAGEALGFLPGDLREKVAPYLRPLYDAIHDMLDPDEGQRYLEEGTIEIAPLAFMRGRTLSRSFVILDEAQNTTREQMFMALTRLGEDSKMVITGDSSQVDLKPGVRSGLAEAEHALQGVEGIAFQRFSQADIIRHAVVGRIVEAYERFRG